MKNAFFMDFCSIINLLVVLMLIAIYTKNSLSVIKAFYTNKKGDMSKMPKILSHANLRDL